MLRPPGIPTFSGSTMSRSGPIGLRRMGTVDHEHELRIDLLLRSNRCDRTGELGGAVPLRQYDDRDLVLGFTAGTLPPLRRHLLG